MCGRYRLTRSDRELTAEFGVSPGDDYAPHYNIAPTQMVPVLQRDRTGELKFRFKRWGLVPFWAKDVKIGAGMINARSETVLQKPALAESFRKHRVLVPADSFYEWKKSPASVGIARSSRGAAKIFKQPFNFGMKDDSVFCFAGIAAKWKSPQNEIVESCSILTTGANTLVADAHDRMPVIIPKMQYQRWLSTEPERAEELLDLLGPYDAAEMKRYPVSQKVNSPENDGPECMESFSGDESDASDESPQAKLF